ncbi:SWI/SNF complex subunit SWI3A [Tanacetum coccineum]|uniref:SWI/SNF complex subunit SWI3A n=1 Tax=Tanacetum coccineum TaxID=301880 RepID=A0ABQ5BKZ3_9ASTR
MEYNNNHNNHFSKPLIPADDPRFEFELYTVPSRAGWFSWDNIHDIEKAALTPFFDGSSFTRNPRVYKEYRDHIISKFREYPSRRLTFSEIRKSLVGDISYLYKVYLFLEHWGLINYGVDKDKDNQNVSDLVKEDEKWKVKVEEGPPIGVRIVAAPNSVKAVTVKGGGGGMGESELKIGMGPLGSYTDVFQEAMEVVCGSCKGRCESGRYECTKDVSSIICSKCFKNGSYGKNKSIDDYKFVDSTPDNGNHVATWTEAETFLLLQSVTKHGDDWDLVAQNVQTKSKQDCISKLIQLPFGQLMFGSTNDKSTNNKSTNDKFGYQDSSNSISNQKQEQGGPPVPQEAKDVEVQNVELESKTQQNGDVDSEPPPAKRICIAQVSDSSDTKMEQTDNQDEQAAQSLVVSEETKEIDGEICERKYQKQQDGDLENHCPMKSDHSKPLPNVGNSLMQQITRISAVVGPHVAASAAEAAVTALCEENEIPKEIFDTEENGKELPFSTQTNETERIAQGNDIEMESESEKGVIPLPLRMRATSATILGAAAAHAKLLAIQEDQEVECLVSTVIGTQLKKLQHKMKLLNEAESIMEKEFAQMTELEDSLLTEREDVIERGIDAGVGRWKDRTAKSQVEIIL